MITINDTTAAQDMRDLEDTAIAALTGTATLTIATAQTVAAACQQFQSRDPLIHRILTADQDTQDHALDRIRTVLTLAGPDPELLTVTAVLTWSITADTRDALHLLTQATELGAATALTDLITQAITLHLPHDTWLTLNADTDLNTLRTGTTR